MKERPILFSGPMVRALLAGTKTQTRRPLYVLTKNFGKACFDRRYPPPLLDWENPQHGPGQGFTLSQWRHARPGDRLWVREAWARTSVFPGIDVVVYREGDNRTDYGGPWKPGIHMFRRDCRILLEVSAVRVERLQDISEADAKAEGSDCLTWSGIKGGAADLIDWPLQEVANPYRNGYALLWEAINGDGSWAANPWVCVVEFRRLP